MSGLCRYPQVSRFMCTILLGNSQTSLQLVYIHITLDSCSEAELDVMVTRGTGLPAIV